MSVLISSQFSQGVPRISCKIFDGEKQLTQRATGQTHSRRKLRDWKPARQSSSNVCYRGGAAKKESRVDGRLA